MIGIRIADFFFLCFDVLISLVSYIYINLNIGSVRHFRMNLNGCNFTPCMHRRDLLYRVLNDLMHPAVFIMMIWRHLT